MHYKHNKQFEAPVGSKVAAMHELEVRSPACTVDAEDNLFYHGRQIKSWKASPNPYSPGSPRMSLTLVDGSMTNVTGSDATVLWNSIKGQEYRGHKHQGSLVYNTTQKEIAGYPNRHYTKKLDPEFEKLKKFVPDTVVVVAKLMPKSSQGVQEHQKFLVRRLDAENCAVVLSPVSGKMVSADEMTFTAQDLCKFKVMTNDRSMGQLHTQHDQIMDKGPKVLVQPYFENWE